jgi:hypothetical protein
MSGPGETAQLVGEVPGEVAGTTDVPEGEQASDFTVSCAIRPWYRWPGW